MGKGAAMPDKPPEGMYDFAVKAFITGFLTERQRLLAKSGLLAVGAGMAGTLMQPHDAHPQGCTQSCYGWQQLPANGNASSGLLWFAAAASIVQILAMFSGVCCGLQQLCL